MAADFFSVDTIFFKRLYVLIYVIYVRLASRQVVLAGCTGQPTQEWVAQHARNLCWNLDDQALKLSHVIHDRDKKFAPSADTVLRADGARVIVTPLMAPRANAHAERWIGSCRRECLDRMLVVDQRHLEEISRAYCVHYNHERPHRSRNLMSPASRGLPSASSSGSATENQSARRAAQRIPTISRGSLTSFLNRTPWSAREGHPALNTSIVKALRLLGRAYTPHVWPAKDCLIEPLRRWGIVLNYQKGRCHQQ